MKVFAFSLVFLCNCLCVCEMHVEMHFCPPSITSTIVATPVSLLLNFFTKQQWDYFSTCAQFKANQRATLFLSVSLLWKKE